MLKIEFKTWPNILKNCKNIFDKEPVLEFAIGPVCKYVIRRGGRSAQFSFFKKGMMPFWRIIKKNFHLTGTFESQIISEKNQIENIVDFQDEKKSYGLFVIWDVRENSFNCIFPVLKKIDELGKNTILFTKFDIYLKKKNEINSLKNNSVIFLGNLIYDLNSYEILKCFSNAHRLFDELLRETKNNDIIKFFKKHKNEIILGLEEILVFSDAVSKIINNIKCEYCFSLGGCFPIIAACKKYGIKTIMIQHGIYSDLEEITDEKEVPPPESSPRAADEILVWGEHAKKQISSFYNYDSDNKVIILGNPRFDSIIDRFVDKQRNKKFYEDLNINPRKKTVVFFSNTYAIGQGEPEGRYIEPIYALDKLYDKLKNKINLVIKLHPKETKKYYDKHMKNLQNIKIIKSEFSLYEILQHTDISTSTESTVLLESMIFKIPTVQLSLTKHGVRGDYYKYGATILFKKSDDFVSNIEKMISDKYDLSELKTNQRKYLDMNLVNLGSATNKIVEHLLNK